MALKDWKKIKNTKNSIIFITKEKSGFIHNQLFVEKISGIWMVNATKNTKVIGVAYPVKTKSQALKFAKAYMRKH